LRIGGAISDPEVERMFPIMQRRAFAKHFAHAVDKTMVAALNALRGHTVSVCMDAATIGVRHVAVVFLCSPLEGTVLLYCMRRIGRTTSAYAEFVGGLLGELDALEITVAGFCTDGLQVQIRAIQALGKARRRKLQSSQSGGESETVENKEQSGGGEGRRMTEYGEETSGTTCPEGRGWPQPPSQSVGSVPRVAAGSPPSQAATQPGSPRSLLSPRTRSSKSTQWHQAPRRRRRPLSLAHPDRSCHPARRCTLSSLSLQAPRRRRRPLRLAHPARS
jgi:hypothetical protein